MNSLAVRSMTAQADRVALGETPFPGAIEPLAHEVQAVAIVHDAQLADEGERVGEAPRSGREGQLCLRMVENHTNFALMFITAYSNMDAMMIASEHWQLDRISARPIGD